MVNATEKITIFNLRYDGETRREKLVATGISGASYYRVEDISGGSSGAENRSEGLTCKIRIPITAQIDGGKEYISETEYAGLSDEAASGYWTIQKGCYVVEGSVPEGNDIKTVDDLRELFPDYVTVREYADDSRRGSGVVRHWRIGGA